MRHDKKDYYGEEAFSHLPADYGQRCTDNFRREERVMSDGKEVKRLWVVFKIGNDESTHQITDVSMNPLDGAIEVMPVTDHDRIVAELKAAAYKVYQQMSATIGHYKNTICDLRAEVERTIRRNIKLNEELAFRDAMILDSKKTIATQARVIERLWSILDSEIRITAQSEGDLAAKRKDYRRQITAIEKEGAKDE